jgi:WhiB family redox-sensing transcriptional regulator
MPRRGTATRPDDGSLIFLGHLPAGRALPFFAGALCASAGKDPNLWHPDHGNRADAQAAKAVCQRCPAREPCLQWAMDTHESHGIWGGTTPRERTALRRAAGERAIQASSPASGTRLEAAA